MRGHIATLAGAVILSAFFIFVSLFFAGSAWADEAEECDHAYAMEFLSATCTEAGECKYVCQKCGESYIDESYSESHPALGHNYETSYSFATCSEPEGTLYVCVRCGFSYLQYDKDNPVFASHPYDVVDSLSPTCTEDGYVTYVCPECGDEYTAHRDAYGHDYGSIQDEKVNGDTIRIYTCIYCGDTYSENLGQIPMNTADAVIMWFQSYQYWLWILLGIGVMVWSIYIGVKYAMARNAEEAAKAKTLVSNYFLGLLSIAVICLALPYLVYIVCWLVV